MTPSRRAFLTGLSAVGFSVLELPAMPASASDVLILRTGDRVEGQVFRWPQRVIAIGNDWTVRSCDFLGPPDLTVAISFVATPEDVLSTRAMIVALRGTTGSSVINNIFSGDPDADPAELRRRHEKWLQNWPAPALS